MDNFHRPPVAKVRPFCYNKIGKQGKESGNHGPRTADMDAKEIGRTISTHRKALGLTQMQLAAQLQVSNRTVSKWENGDGFPDISLLPGLAAALDITIDELLTGKYRRRFNRASAPQKPAVPKAATRWPRSWPERCWWRAA